MSPRLAWALSLVAIVLCLIAGAVPGDPALPPPLVLLPGFDPSAAVRIQLGFRGGTATLLRQDGIWHVAERDSAPADPARVRTLLSDLAALRLLERRTDDPERLAGLGLDGPDATVLRVTAADGTTLAGLALGHVRPGGRGVYLRAIDQNQAWLAAPPLPVSAAPADWLATVILSLPAAKVARITVRPEHEPPFTLVRDGGHLTLPGTPLDPFKADALAAALDGLRLIDIRAGPTPAPPPQTEFFADGLTVGVIPLADGWFRFTAAGGDLATRLDHWAFRLPPDRAAALTQTLATLRAYAK